MFERDRFQAMADQLAGIRGKIILSINDGPEVREIFPAFRFDEVALKYIVSSGGATDAAELITSNFELRFGLL
ncbi:hypothetical protein [Pseudophaeobacter sp. C1-32P7]|uniref:hypothetical protein n=1 Tax=Pseudophaeobacter sp. C1-32P7 TaxID=3098142 RepID=UPI0034D67E9B